MLIIGCDYHPSFQQIAFVDTDTGELQERRLEHREEAEKFYRDLAAQGIEVRVGMEASGRIEDRVMDWGCQRDRQEEGAQAEDGSPGCTAYSEVNAEG